MLKTRTFRCLNLYNAHNVYLAARPFIISDIHLAIKDRIGPARWSALHDRKLLHIQEIVGQGAMDS